MVKEENKRIQITIPRELLEKIGYIKNKQNLSNLIIFLLENHVKEGVKK